ncbi:MAG: hypothetical protein ACRDPT_14475 [Streptomycetales bacterium]
MRGATVTPPALNAEWRHWERIYQVVLPDALGHPMLAFRDGYWYQIGSDFSPHPVTAHTAILRHPSTAGSIVQVLCWWMREHYRHPRALDLATELSLAVSELARVADLNSPSRYRDDPLTGPL